MLKYTHDAEKSEISLEIKGNLLDLLAESTYMVKTIYNKLKEKNPAQAEEFKKLVIRSIGDESSPVWADKSLLDKLIDTLKEAR